MRYFFKLTEGVNVQPLLHQLVRNPQLWNADKFRTTFPNSPHSEADDILLRFSDTEKMTTTTHVIGDNNPVWHPAAKVLTEAKPIILDLMRAVGAYELGRVIISRLKPGDRILEHADKDGDYVHTPDRARYHVVLQNLPGSIYNCGNESVCFKAGDVFWFNAHELHSVVNNSVDDRISLMVDVTTWS